MSHGNAAQLGDAHHVNLDVDGKAARSIFSFKGYQEKTDSSLIEVTIETGRKHQIRLHAQSLGYPVIGDRLHGKQQPIDASNDLQLCAVYLAFKCPIIG